MDGSFLDAAVVVRRASAAAAGPPGLLPGQSLCGSPPLFQIAYSVKGLIKIRRDALYSTGKLSVEVNPRDRDDNWYNDSNASKHY